MSKGSIYGTKAEGARRWDSTVAAPSASESGLSVEGSSRGRDWFRNCWVGPSRHVLRLVYGLVKIVFAGGVTGRRR